MPRGSQAQNKKPTEKKKCIKCSRELPVEINFYKTRSLMFDGRTPICKQCILSLVNYDDIQTVYNVLQQLDIKFDYMYWNKAIESPKETLGNYITMANSLHQFDGTGWKDSVFEPPSQETVLGNEINHKKNLSKDNFILTDELIEKWGENYNIEEYRAFERKYNMLKNNYQEKTAMHTEALLTYIRYRVKEELAAASNLFKEAEAWGKLAKDAATAAKINPSQLSKSDLTDGLDTFGQLVRTVEQAEDIIPILPKFKERPQDKVDFTIWCYVNYVRDLKGLPPVEYAELYGFIEIRKKEYEEHLNNMYDDNDLSGEDE